MVSSGVFQYAHTAPEELLPLVPISQSLFPQHCFQGSIGPLNKAVTLRVIGGSVKSLYCQLLANI